MTLEDETAQVNVILWPGLLEKFRKEALIAALLEDYGVWQTDGKVWHLTARRPSTGLSCSGLCRRR
ncbi:hypothetical protein BDI4_1240003 [Burkholderia diffusa]|nr:hypothetical protein BDI4_1240003 [Burkholderia diffusa]